MKKIQLLSRNATSYLFLLFISSILSTLFFYGCSKPDEIDKQTDGDTTSINVTIAGVTEPDVENTPQIETKSIPLAIAPTTRTGEAIVSEKTIRWDDVEMDIITSEGYDLSFGENMMYPAFEKIKQTKGVKHASVSSLNPLAVNVPMEIGVKYRLILYNKKTQKYEKSIQAVSGTAMKVDVVRNQEYEWYAYSHNNQDNIPAPNLTSLQLQSPTDKPLLYAKGTITANLTGNTPLSITFQHQLQQIKVNLDTRGLFGNINSVVSSFTTNGYIKSKIFNLRTGLLTGTATTVPTTTLTFNRVEADSKRQMQARYYTADFTQKTYGFRLNTLDIELPNGTTQNLMASYPSGRSETFTFSAGGPSKVHHANIKMWRVVPRKKILHIEGHEQYSYAASQPDKASGAFLRSTTNFGPSSRYLRIEGFTHEIISGGAGAIETRLANPANYPDIIIAAMINLAREPDYAALGKYVERGGTLFLMIDRNYNDRPLPFFKKIFGPTVTLAELDNSGAMYKLESVDSDVLAWPFADVRGKYWGQDANSSLYVQNIPASKMNEIIVYTRSSVNFSAQYPSNSVTMFRHKTLNLFFAGDTGFLSNESKWGSHPTTNTIHPFATNASYFPIPRANYGRVAQLGSPEYGKKAGDWGADNSAIFGNIFSLIISQSQYTILDKSP